MHGINTTNWLERAKHEIAASEQNRTANTAERNLTAVLAVPEVGKVRIFQLNFNDGASDETQIEGEEHKLLLQWLHHIGEDDVAAISDFFQQLACYPHERHWFVMRAKQALALPERADDRRHCAQCVNLAMNGVCLAAQRGDIFAVRGYRPAATVLRRCKGFTMKVWR